MRGVRADLVEHYARAREEAIRLAWLGLKPAAIARKVGVSKGTALNWLRGAGFETAPEKAGTFPCPECGERLVRHKSLFFWWCRCGAEFWPPEDVVPDDPELWTLPVGLGIEPEAFILIRERLTEHGVTFEEIAAELNRRGFRTETGKPWTRKRVAYFAEASGLRFERGWAAEYEEALKLIEYQARRGYLFSEIAEALNARGLRTRYGTPWSEDTVEMIYLRHFKDEPGRRINRLSKARLPDRMQNNEHPWRADEHRRILENRRRYGRDLSQVQGGYEVGK